jgi:hypothetical protein
MLKNPKLLGLLRAPDDPDGEPLQVQGNSLVGAGWQIPIVGGIPDLITHAPTAQRSITFIIPFKERPSLEVLKPPIFSERPPNWFDVIDHPKGATHDRVKGAT